MGSRRQRSPMWTNSKRRRKEVMRKQGKRESQKSVRLIGKHRKQRQHWHPALLSPYTCKLSLTSHTLDEGKFVQRYSGKASERRQEVK